MLNGQKLKHLKSHSNPTPSALVTGMTTALWVWPRFHSMDLGHSRVPFRYGHDHCAIGMTPGIWNIRRRTTRWIRNRRQVQVRWLFRRVGAKFRQCWPRWDLRRARQFSLCGRIRSRWRTKGFNGKLTKRNVEYLGTFSAVGMCVFFSTRATI